ncbi:retrovirus-related pol polyprotein from transposon TNT 1-94 [Tanacetum coccineum]
MGMVDNTLFTKKKSSNLIIVQIYVDDIIFDSTCLDMCDEFAKIMHDEFEMSMMGELNFFFGLQIKQMEDDIFFNQSKYIKEMLKKFGLEDSKPMKTPMSSNTKLTKDEEYESIDSTKYRGMIGSLLYLMASRPDIMFSVCLCARFQEDPKTSHLEAVKRIFRYIKGNTHLGLWYPKGTGIETVVYAESDHAGDYVDRKSTSVDYSSSDHFSSDDSSRDSSSSSSSETSFDSSADALSDPASSRSSSDHSLPTPSSEDRSPAASIPLSSPTLRVLSYAHADLLPSPKRIRSPETATDLEGCSEDSFEPYVPREAGLGVDFEDESSESSRYRGTDLEMDVDVMRSDEIDIDPEIQAEIDECIAYAGALRDRGIDARVVVEAIDRDEIETGMRGPIEVRVDRVTHPVVANDISEPAQEGAVEVTYETLGDLVQRFHDHTEEILLEWDNMRLRDMMDVVSQRVARSQRRELRVQKEMRQIRLFRFYDRMRIARLEACARRHLGYRS